MAQALVHRSRAKLRSAMRDEENTMCLNFAGDLREMLKVLDVIEPALEGTERYSLRDEAAREWLKRVRSAAYGISDMIDELQDRRPRKTAGISVVLKKNLMSSRMKDMMQELTLLQGSQRFASTMPETIGLQLKKPLSPSPPRPLPPSPSPTVDFLPPPTPSGYLAQAPPPLREVTRRPKKLLRAPEKVTHIETDEGNIVGRAKNKQMIIATLSSTDITGGPTILPIYGLAAVGKTALAEMVFKDAGFGEYKFRIWVNVTPKFDLFEIGNHLVSKILQENNLEMENQRSHRPYHGNRVREEEINTTADMDMVTGAYQDSEEKINQVKYSPLREIGEETKKGSDWPPEVLPEDINKVTYETCIVSEEEIKKGSDETCQLLEEVVNKATYESSNLSEDEINKGLGGTSQVLAEVINKGSNEASQVSEEEINNVSDGTSRVLAEHINKDTCEITEVLENQEISTGVDGTWDYFFGPVEKLPRILEEEIHKGSDGASQVSEDEINYTSSDGTSRILEKQINKCSDGASQVSEDEIDYSSDGTSRVLEKKINKGTCEIAEVLDDQEISTGVDGIPPSPPVREGDLGLGDTWDYFFGPEILLPTVSDDVDYITKRLQELLNGVKALIVLDDLWEEDSHALEGLKRMLGVGIKGSNVNVIVTTCNQGIARKICTVNVKPHKLDPLKTDRCWTIIKQESGFGNRPDSDQQELERIGLQIASKCAGLPLAAQELGRSLHHGDARSWEEAMKRDVWSNIQSDNDVILRSLELSYISLPSALRLCFAYCAIFPQGDTIVKEDIIHQWIALGLVEPSGSLSITQVAEDYITRLLDISFLQTAESATSTSGSGDMGAILLTMNELAHALARSVCDELNVPDEKMCIYECCRYAVLTDCGMKNSSKLPDQLRVLRCVGCSEIDLGDDAFSPARCLRILHLNKCSMQKLPDSICRLRQLGYLNLSGCSQLVSLPESFGSLLNLWHINLSRCYGLAQLPESFRKLRRLVYLDLSFWSCFEGISVLGSLTNLMHLNLSHPCCYRAQDRAHLKGLMDVLCKLTSLQYLNLSMCMNPIFSYLPEEQCCEYIRSCTRGLSNLKHLDLSHNIFLVDLPESLGELQRLHTLDLTGCIRLKSIAKRIRENKSLKLIVRNCRDLESRSSAVRTDDGCFRSKLVQLEVVNCQNLEVQQWQ